MKMSTSSFIARKRDGQPHRAQEIAAFIQAFLRGDVADYQMSAWLMAVYLRGLDDEETVALTQAMLQSGRVMTRPLAGPPRIDKHSTGGVGDKISLPLAAIAASCGLSVPMIAGRGLGHTGGTLDKLEAISGYQVSLSAQRFAQIVKKVGASIMGQTADIAPADRRMYALRDVTATVACRPLIVASILSKKLAANLDGLVLDVKVGRGAFMTNLKDARALGKSLVRVANQLGTKTIALLTDMDQPLGRCIGNALEVKESIDILRGTGQRDVTDLTLRLVSEMLVLGKVATTRKQALALARRSIAQGHALERFCQMVEMHGGDPHMISDPARLPRARRIIPVLSPQDGCITDIHPMRLAQLAQELGAGRRLVSDSIDPAVGIELCAGLGDHVERGATLCHLHAQTRAPQLTAQAQAAFTINQRPKAARPLVLEQIRS